MVTAPQDQEDRDRALDPRGSFHLEAPAGSGKTAVLLARFLTLLAQINDSPRELLTLTFTRKAAGEFRERAMRYFWSQEELGPNIPPHERQLLNLAGQAFRHLERKNLLQYLHVPERLPVTTFHGFCAQLLKAAPHEAGIPLEFQVLESDRDAEWQKQEALEELRRRLSARAESDPVRQALVRRLVRLNNNWPRLVRELRDLLSRRDTLKDFLALAQRSVEEEAYAALMEKQLSRVVAHVLTPLADMLKKTELHRCWPEFLEAVQENGGAPSVMTLPNHPPEASRQDLSAWQGLAEILMTKSGGLRKRWPKGIVQSGWPETLKELESDFLARLHKCRTLPLELFSIQELGALQDLILLLHAAWEVYEELCRQRRVLDFIDIEEAALRLLHVESPGELLFRLDWQLKHVLVDEFQDTSDNQMGLLCRLLSGWTAGDGRTLTVVGDPKQSIYGWRQARLHLFLESRHGLTCEGRQTLPLAPLSLTTNFRATPTLITWVNQVFGQTVMGGETNTGGLEFKEAYPGPGQKGGEAPGLAIFADEDRDEARTREARWLAGRVGETMRDFPVKEHLALLLFARTHLVIYLSALQEAGLVPKVREGLKLTETRVVQHLHNLARALVRPQDDVAWATLLTGPWVEPDLVSLAAAAKTPGEVWPEKLGRFAAFPTCPSEVAHLTRMLLSARERVGREFLSETLERFLEASGAWTGVAAWEGALGVACARTYLKLVEESETGLAETTFLKTDFALEEAYQPPDPRAEDSPLEVLTVHGAKGLEFHTVFLPYLDWRPLGQGGQSPPFLLEEVPGTRAHVLGLAPPAWRTGKDSSYRLVKILQDARVLAEARRVFYVAVTRAQQRLFLSGVLSRSQGTFAPPSDSPLAWLWQHYRPAEVTPGNSLLWTDPVLRVEMLPEISQVRRSEMKPPPLPEPWEFLPEPPPYRLSFPSQAADVELQEKVPAPEGLSGEWDNLAARARGEVTHRLLQSKVLGEGLPGKPGVAAALVSLGVPWETAQTLAPEILAEVRTCLQDPFLGGLLFSQSSLTEWLLEDQPAPSVIRRGRLDLLAFDGREWWLVDFKTSRPPQEGAWENFLLFEQEKYRPQLLAYREMTAKAKGISPEIIRLALYFTACRKAVEL